LWWSPGGGDHDGVAGTGQDTVVWRVSDLGRVLCTVAAVGCGGGAVALLIVAATGHGGGRALVGAAMLALIAAGLLWFSWRPSITLADDRVVVRNPFGTVTVPLQRIVATGPGYTGLVLRLADGTVVTAWAVQKTNLATWLHRDTRSDRVAAQILRAAHAARW
jgi:ABC-type Fe3+-hydroxamate transport system substrate-binding protein